MKIEVAKEKYIPDCGDILFGSDYISSKFDRKTVKSLLLFHNLNQWNSLIELDIDHSKFKNSVRYMDFLTNNEYFWFLPIMITSTEKDVHIKFNKKESVYTDIDYCLRSFYDGDKLNKPYKISQSLLGHGYTYGTLPDDGDNTIDLLNVDLNETDKITGYCWIWFNK